MGYWGNMFIKSFEKKAVIKALGKEIWEAVKPTKLNMGMNALGLYDSAATTARKMKVPLGAPREL